MDTRLIAALVTAIVVLLVQFAWNGELALRDRVSGLLFFAWIATAVSSHFALAIENGFAVTPGIPTSLAFPILVSGASLLGDRLFYRARRPQLKAVAVQVTAWTALALSVFWSDFVVDAPARRVPVVDGEMMLLLVFGHGAYVGARFEEWASQPAEDPQQQRVPASI